MIMKYKVFSINVLPTNVTEAFGKSDFNGNFYLKKAFVKANISFCPGYKETYHDTYNTAGTSEEKKSGVYQKHGYLKLATCRK